MTENEMVGRHHLLKGHESEQTLGVDDGQGALACCNHWCQKGLDTTERLNQTELKLVSLVIKNPPAKAGDKRDEALIPG